MRNHVQTIPPSDPSPDFTTTVNHLIEVLEYDKRAGLRGIEFSNAPAPAIQTGTDSMPPKKLPKSLEAIAAHIAACTACKLCKSRTNTVPGQGNPRPELVFVGEGPGADEDEQGMAFVGRSGQLLTKMIEAMGLARDEVWIGNIVKCRPPNNRVPEPDEVAACIPFLKDQLALLKPKVIVCLGGSAVTTLLQTQETISKTRGKWQSFCGIDVMPTYHPAYLLRNPSAKHDTWTDLKAVVTKLGRKLPAKKQGQAQA